MSGADMQNLGLTGRSWQRWPGCQLRQLGLIVFPAEP